MKEISQSLKRQQTGDGFIKMANQKEKKIKIEKDLSLMDSILLDSLAYRSKPGQLTTTNKVRDS